MFSKSRKHILSQLFDVKPMTAAGNLHLEKIYSVKKCLNLKSAKKNSKAKRKEENKLNLSGIITSYYQPILKNGAGENQSINELNKEEIIEKLAREHKTKEQSDENLNRKKILTELEEFLGEKNTKRKDNFLEVMDRHGFNKEQSDEGKINQNFIEQNSKELNARRIAIPSKKNPPIFKFVGLAGFLLIGALGFYFLENSINYKDLALSYAISASKKMAQAKDDLKKFDFKSAEYEFSKANDDFKKSKKTIGEINYFLLSSISGLPIISSTKFSGINLVDAGQYLAQSGELLSQDLANLSSFEFKNMFNQNGKSEITALLKNFNKDLDQLLDFATLAEKNINKVDLSSLPDNLTKADLPEKAAQFKSSIIEMQKYVKLALDLLGAKRAQDYLLLFQNPGEMRASGGFIGSYGIVSLDDGKIKKIFIDDIFNPDGQLREKIIPPFPIQKISTAWSMHDSNWFFDFPASAKKAAWFYEKTGGPTVSAVVALNPYVIEKLLEITGPIDMPQYDTAIVSENFIDIVQYKVEKDFDKEENKPKKILADFMPKFLERLFSKKENAAQIMQILFESVKEKDVMVYSFNEDVQKLISQNNFSGEIVESKNDYLAVVSSNINGYKTDRVIDGDIDLKSEVDENGFTMNTLTITKKHTGGDLNYDFYNKVNADYLRVYVPEGSMLIDAKGYTIEANKSPVDYEKLGFKKDEDVAKIESSLIIDDKTKTQIYKESGKTVFGNWVFVSPKENVEIVYKYRLPKKVNFNEGYQAVFQKQSGGNMKLNWNIDFANNARILSDDKDLNISGSSANLKSDFKEDKIVNLTIN